MTALFMVPAANWYGYWVEHKESLMILTVINTGLTTVSEVGSRVVVPAIRGVKNDGFIVVTPEGNHRIHRQSLINIVMTILASILGGPVYFLAQRWHRFLFFISFGVFNSIMSQGISSMMIEGTMFIMVRRIYFDFFYNATIKYFMFEYIRPYLLRHKSEVKMVLTFRVIQDFLTTCVRGAILGLINLKGF